MKDSIEQHDVIIIGAGLSGIGAAYHLQRECPGKSFVLLEARAAMGGTWDLFKYPGIRSDSDMYTLGFSFRPWENPKAIADGPAILQYIKDTAREFGIDRKIRYQHKVVAADWSDTEKQWILTIGRPAGEAELEMRCRFLVMCSGYYNYDEGYSPVFPCSETFRGTIIHPQQWDASLDYTDKNVIVIGSGATAVTLVPELAKRARQVTMLQRSPSYIMNLPSEDSVANFLKRILPMPAAHTLTRWKNILVSMVFYQLSRRSPDAIRRLLQKMIQKELGDKYEQKDFDPSYNPWDQRLCLVPDNDLFQAIKAGTARMVTDTITRFTPAGILIDSGQELLADIIVTATGLNVQLFGGMELRRNGEKIDPATTHAYKGVMLEGIPNFAIAIGYTNASWTLKCDLNGYFITKVLNYLDEHGYTTCTPRFDEETFQTEPLLDLDAGYVRRASHLLPKQGSRAPWKVYQNYLKDLFALKYGSVEDGYLEYR